MEVFVARQPIFNRNKDVIAYELLYRDSNKNFFNNTIGASKATSILIANSYFSIGIEKLIGKHKAFINFNKSLIERDIPMIFDKDTIVIEILEDVVPDKKFINTIKKLKEMGYTIALDDFTYDYAYDEIVELCDIIKVDFLQNTEEDVYRIIQKWDNKTRKFLAEKIENNEVLNYAKKIGYDYFQGYFFDKPVIIKGKRLKDNKIQYLRIMEELNKDDPSYDNIAKIIEYDINLTYKLLKLVNSKFTLSHEIQSIKHALTLMGLKEIQVWITLIMIQDIKDMENNEILKTSLVRAKLGQRLAESSIHKKRKNEAMLMGLISVIDILLEEPMEKILNKLPISNDIKNPLMGKESPLSDIYNLMINYEKASWEELCVDAKKIEIDIKKLPDQYFKAVQWADELFEYMLAND
ncbi:EAL and HDOD domain-containing protein [Crassaminicella profunda]|uniref:EAL and HDOD domain-containing protein n=1 Tax=Crassaminicella profunda TaxID=1286698 RepID=UPI001CA62AD2|nr:HDOD domain-containing protein [Crassaminicella profunda]QZY56621.1 HDOD domain-containing protein [Crassaminicella profunda]